MLDGVLWQCAFRSQDLCLVKFKLLHSPLRLHSSWVIMTPKSVNFFKCAAQLHDSEARGPGPNLLRRGRFAALAEDDTESVDNHEPDGCPEEVTQEGGRQGIPTRRRRRLRIFWQEAVEADERVMKCGPTQIEPDSYDERLARVWQRQRDACSWWWPSRRADGGARKLFSSSGSWPRERHKTLRLGTPLDLHAGAHSSFAASLVEPMTAVVGGACVTD